MTDFAGLRDYLHHRRDYLEQKLHDYEDTLDQRPPADAEDRATEREGDEVMERLGLAGLDEIAQIRAALIRLDAGTYGVCATCGNTIERARLTALPCTTVCAHCAVTAHPRV